MAALDDRTEPERRLIALGRQLQPYGRPPTRDRWGEWHFSLRAPSGLVRAFVTLADELGLDRFEVLEPPSPPPPLFGRRTQARRTGR